MSTGGHILVVDDERSLRKLLRLQLEAEGYTVAEAGNGREALEQVRSGGIDLVMLDYMMPEMDGLETCQRLRTEYPGLPVIMLTARDGEIDRIMGL